MNAVGWLFDRVYAVWLCWNAYQIWRLKKKAEKAER